MISSSFFSLISALFSLGVRWRPRRLSVACSVSLLIIRASVFERDPPAVGGPASASLKMRMTHWGEEDGRSGSVISQGLLDGLLEVVYLNAAGKLHELRADLKTNGVGHGNLTSRLVREWRAWPRLCLARHRVRDCLFAHRERYNERALGLFPIPHFEVTHSGLKHGHGAGERAHRRTKPVGVHGFPDTCRWPDGFRRAPIQKRGSL